MSTTLTKEQQAALESLADADNYIEPDDVVEEARDVDSPLHEKFEWTDAEAARIQRLDVARGLIRSLRFEVTVEHHVYAAPRYVVDPDRPPKSKRYAALTSIARERVLAQQVLVDEMSRITNAIERARAVAAVLGLNTELQAMLRKATAIRERVVEESRRRSSPGKRPSGTRKPAAKRRRAS